MYKHIVFFHKTQLKSRPSGFVEKRHFWKYKYVTHVLSLSFGHTNTVGCEVIQLAKDTTLLTEIGGGVIAFKDTSGLECTSTLDAQNLIFSQDTHTDIQSTVDSEAVLLKNDTSWKCKARYKHVLSLSDTFGHTNTVGCEVIQLAKDTTLLTEIGGGVIELKDTSGLEFTSTLDAQELTFIHGTTTGISSVVNSEMITLTNNTSSGNTNLELNADKIKISNSLDNNTTISNNNITLSYGSNITSITPGSLKPIQKYILLILISKPL